MLHAHDAMLFLQAYWTALHPIKHLLYNASMQELVADHWISNLPLEKAQTLSLRKDGLVGVGDVSGASALSERQTEHAAHKPVCTQYAALQSRSCKWPASLASCAVLCCAVLCCAVLCCAMLC
jgi:hypothetical protein